MKEALRNSVWAIRDARIVLLARGASTAGTALTNLAALLLLHDAGVGPYGVTVFIACAAVPTIATMGIAGRIADTVDSRRVLAIAGAVQAAFHHTDLVVHNVPVDESDAETVAALASGAAAGAGVAFTTVPAPADGGSGVDEFLAAAESADVDLIVLGIRHRTPVGKLILGSTEQQILLDARGPVLAVKA